MLWTASSRFRTLFGRWSHWLFVVGRLLWRWFIWDPHRRVGRFRYADCVLEFETKRDGLQTLTLGQMAGVFARHGRGGRVFDWLIRR